MNIPQPIPQLVPSARQYDSEAVLGLIDKMAKVDEDFYLDSKRGSLSKVLLLTGGMMASVLSPQETLAKKVAFQSSNENSLNAYLGESKAFDEQCKYLASLYCTPTRQDYIKKINSFKTEGWDDFDDELADISSANAISIIEKLSIGSLAHIDLIYPSNNSTISIKWDNEKAEKLSLSIGAETFSYYYKLNSEHKPKFFNNVEISAETVNRLDQIISQLFA